MSNVKKVMAELEKSFPTDISYTIADPVGFVHRMNDLLLASSH